MKHCSFRLNSLLIVVYCRPGNVCRDQDGEWKVKGLWTGRFDSAESAEKACRMMNGTKINGREVDVRIDRNAQSFYSSPTNTLPHSALTTVIFCFVLKTQLLHISMCPLFDSFVYIHYIVLLSLFCKPFLICQAVDLNK